VSVHYSKGNIFIWMEDDLHIPILPGSRSFFPFYRKVKAIIVIPIFFYRESKIRHSSLQCQTPHFAMCRKWRIISLWFNPFHEIRMA